MRLLVFAALTALATSVPALAQPGLPEGGGPPGFPGGGGPPGFPGDPGSGGPPGFPPVPLDGGLGLLALAGGAYAAHRLRRR